VKRYNIRAKSELETLANVWYRSRIRSTRHGHCHVAALGKKMETAFEKT
jgi:hypothetical protein